ncbi:hypothetical protein M0R89_19365 (plasmid) [Halorussus limi]|uniref:Uncharacterized protein n=1 Tax=Halorussus limi TaxID=2938695 RepID=A0A8U0I0I4_9EURY|nr:hypothetical protein [Halorussus limi]UPV76324.1 hypothetical protein M0R89_19365 [Halorussus limi]
MSTQPTFSPLSDATGLDIVDPIETRHFSLFTDSPVTPTDADADEFAFPVATACRITTGRLGLPYMVPMEVRSPDGAHRASIDLPTTREFPDDEYLLELHSPIKVYLRTTGGMTIDTDDDGVEIEFEGEVAVEVGARSYHSSPAATITVPDDPAAVMEAVSAFPSALKTTSPERAWPTLRGHPPRVERGDELSIPDGLKSPDTGIEIAVPAEYGHVYTVAPLAYYLGADVVPGETARLTAESGVDRLLGDDAAAVGESVEEILKRVFLLDCVTRTEGLYPDELHEREVLESHVDLDFGGLYEASLADRLAAYLAVPDEAFAAIESPWHRVTHVEGDPGPDAAELLPYVVNDLSLVRVKSEREDAWSPTEAQKETNEALNAFVRSPTTAASTTGVTKVGERTTCHRRVALRRRVRNAKTSSGRPATNARFGGVTATAWGTRTPSATKNRQTARNRWMARNRTAAGRRTQANPIATTTPAATRPEACRARTATCRSRRPTRSNRRG